MQTNIPLAQFTTLKIGGPAKFFTKAESAAKLAKAIEWAKEKNIPYLIIGSGSNLLISDEGYPGLIIKNEFCGLATQGLALRGYSGTPLRELVDFTIRNSLGGMEKLTGISGTIGGAIFGNAGAYGQTICDHLKEIKCLDPSSGKIVTLHKSDCGFGYRDSGFKRNNLIILEATFEFEPSDVTILKQESTEILKKRERFNGLKCPGSFFKNIPLEKIPPQALKLIPHEQITFGKVSAGYLLETVGAKNQKLGDIQIKDWHANLFVNNGQGRAADFYQLAQSLAKKVKERFDIDLETEVQLINLPKNLTD